MNTDTLEQSIEYSRLKEAKEIAKSHPDECLAICNEILNTHFEDDLGQYALFLAAYVMLEAERFGLAYSLYQRLAQLRPDRVEVFLNMAMCLEESDPEGAIRLFKACLKKKPDYYQAMANLGLMYLQTGEPQKCIDYSDRALKLKPDLRSAYHNKGLAQLMLREHKAGWKAYYDTIGVKHREKRDYGLPEWDGQSEGEIVIYGEQGVGDEIMFASLLYKVKNPVVFDCDKRLESLFKRSFPDLTIYGTRFKKETPLMDNHSPDYQLAIGQLPHFFIEKESDYPGKPYLQVDKERSVQWRALFDTFKGRKIGVAWRGGLKNTLERNRSLELDDLAPIFDENNTYISLEYKPVTDEQAEKYNLKRYEETFAGKDIDGLAALVSQLDLVITACTTVVYVAGALGIPCLVLVPNKPGYRYMIEGESFPWYRSVKLFRQLPKESWGQCVKRFHTEYRHWIRSEGDGGVSRPVPFDSVEVKQAS